MQQDSAGNLSPSDRYNFILNLGINSEENKDYSVGPTQEKRQDVELQRI
jgi:hypothetical protein